MLVLEASKLALELIELGELSDWMTDWLTDSMQQNYSWQATNMDRKYAMLSLLNIGI